MVRLYRGRVFGYSGPTKQQGALQDSRFRSPSPQEAQEKVNANCNRESSYR